MECLEKICLNISYVLYYRFLRHVPVVYVDYPGKLSLCQIYGTFNRAMLRLVPSLKPYAEPLTNAMVEFYLMSQVNNGYYKHLKSACLLPLAAKLIS